MTDDIMLVHGDAFDELRKLPDKSIGAIITDPPYDLSANDSLVLLEHLRRVCRGNIIVFCKPENQYWIADEYLFWIKTPSTKNYVRNCGRFVEMILVLRQGDTFNPLYWSQMTGVFDDRLIYPTRHPYEKPLTLLERLIRIYTNDNDLVLDPFMGSGTCGKACSRLNRRYIGIEKELNYYELANSKIYREA